MRRADILNLRMTLPFRAEESEPFWNSVVQDVLNRRTITRHDQMRAYTHCYETVLQNKAFLIHENLRNVIVQHLKTKVQEQILPSVPTTTFVQVLNNVWDDYLQSIKKIRCIHAYLERLNFQSIDNLGLEYFRDQVVDYEAIRDHLRDTFMNIFSGERSRQILPKEERQSLQKAFKILNELRTPLVSWYEEHFERPFLLQATQFYETDSQAFPTEVNAQSLSLYISYVDARIDDERQRANFYDFNESTKCKMIEVVEKTMITKHKKEIKKFLRNSGLVESLDSKKTEELGFIYNLFNHLPCCLLILYECVSQHLREKGKVLVREMDDERKPTTFVQNWLDFKDHYDDFLINSFHDDKILENMMAKDFQYLLKENENSQEYLSLFIQEKLEQEFDGIFKQEFESVLSKAMTLLKFSLLKEDFIPNYPKQFNNRLSLNESLSDGRSIMTNSTLKAECAYERNTKLDVMMNDLNGSNILMNEFKRHIALHQLSLSGLDLSVRVLSTIFWPITFTSHGPVGIFPQFLHEAFETFKSFYLNFKHSGRTLSLNPRLGSAELRVNGYRPHKNGKEQNEDAISVLSSKDTMIESNLISRETIIIEVSTYQMLILLLFNDQNSQTYEDILKKTKIPEKDLKRSLQSLSMGTPSQRILRRISFSEDIDQSDTFNINESFSSELDRVKFKTYPLEGKLEPPKNSNNEMDEKRDRMEKIDAAIVRIMKVKLIFSHASLVEECTEQLKSRFLPSSEAIKERVEKLIQLQYIARSEDNSNVYTYIE